MKPRKQRVRVSGFVERLRDRRQKLGFSGSAMDEAAGFARGTIGQYESQGREPSLQALIDLAKALRTSTDYLLGLSHRP